MFIFTIKNLDVTVYVFVLCEMTEISTFILFL
jgi:hypothetical protein